jgi:hypothetical protein
MAPQLDKIKVWEYYKYENGAYHNYALVINPQDTDVTLTIVKHHGWYYKPWPPNTMVSDGPYGIATTDSTMWNKLVHEPGDTFKNGIKLKAHEKKIIPDFFESIRSLNPLNKLGPTQLIHIAVLANGQYAGDYTIKKITLPDSLPKSGIIYCLRINSGEPLPLFVHLSETRFKSGKIYSMTIYHFKMGGMDTVEISAMDTNNFLDKFFGLACYKPSTLTVNPSRESYVISEERKTKNVMHMKLVNVNDETNITIKTPDTKKVAFVGINFTCLSPFWGRNQRVEILIPMNIKL